MARHRVGVCTTPGCPNLSEGGGKCEDCEREARAASDARRPSAAERGYDTRWAQTRAAYLAAHPTCECDGCLERPLHVRPRATDVHHRDGLGPLGPFGHDFRNLLALSHDHHSQLTSSAQPGGWNAR